MTELLTGTYCSPRTPAGGGITPAAKSELFRSKTWPIGTRKVPPTFNAAPGQNTQEI